MIRHKRWSIRVTYKKPAPGATRTEWSCRPAYERAAIIAAPFPSVIRRMPYPWAGTIAVIGDSDDVGTIARRFDLNADRAYRANNTFDNIIRTMEGD